MADALILFRNNDCLLEVTLKNEVSGQAINNATFVRCQSLKRGGTNITGQTFPVDLTYISGSEGVYRATLSNALAVTDEEKLVALIKYDAGPGMVGEIEPDVVVRRRRGT